MVWGYAVRLLAFLLALPLCAATVTVPGQYATIQLAVNYCAGTWVGPEPCIISIDSTFTHVGQVNLIEQTTAKKWIILRSSRIAELPTDTRVALADGAKMPKMTKSGRTSAPIVYVQPKASHYRLEGLEFIGYASNQADFAAGVHWRMVFVGNPSDSDNPPRFVRDFSHNIVIDRCIFRCNAATESCGVSDAVTAIASNMTITNNWFGYISSLTHESKAIGCFQCGSDLTVRNNYIEALSIGTIMGGGGTVPARGYTPVISRWFGNRYTKRPEWKTATGTSDPTTLTCVTGERYRYTTPEPDESWACTGTPGQLGTFTRLGVFRTTTSNPDGGACVDNDLIEQTNASYPNFWECVGGVYVATMDTRQWTEDRQFQGAARGNTGQKNLQECKTCRGFWSEGNVMGPGYAPGSGTQFGTAFLLNRVDDHRAQLLEDIRFVNNRAFNVGKFLSIGYSGTASNYDRLTPSNILIENNLVVNVGDPLYYRIGAGSRINVVANDVPLGGGLIMQKNTIIPNAAWHDGMASARNGTPRMVVRSNIMGTGNYWLYPDPNLPSDARYTTAWPGADLRNNVSVVDYGSYNRTWLTDLDSTWNYIPSSGFTNRATSWAGVGFVSFAAYSGTAAGQTVGGTGDYRLCTGAGVPHASCAGASSVATAGLGSTAPGANIDLVTWATETAETGAHNPWFDFQIRQADSRGIRYTAYSTAACTVTVDDDASYGSPLYSATGASGSRDRYLSAATLGLDVAAAGVYYAKVACDGGRYREATIRK